MWTHVLPDTYRISEKREAHRYMLGALPKVVHRAPSSCYSATGMQKEKLPFAPHFESITNTTQPTQMSEELLKETMAFYSRENPGLENVGCQQWLVDSAAKRYIWRLLYGLIPASGMKILDIGGGISSMTCYLAESHHYQLADVLVHDSADIAHRLAEKYRFFLHQCDWATLPYFESDVIIAVDLFPNVDQRLSEFLYWAENRAPLVILLLTFYPFPRSYLAKRVDTEELLTVCAWGKSELSRCLADHYGETNCDDAIDQSIVSDSLFHNGRRCIAMTSKKVDQKQK